MERSDAEPRPADRVAREYLEEALGLVDDPRARCHIHSALTRLEADD